MGRGVVVGGFTHHRPHIVEQVVGVEIQGETTTDRESEDYFPWLVLFSLNCPVAESVPAVPAVPAVPEELPLSPLEPLEPPVPLPQSGSSEGQLTSEHWLARTNALLLQFAPLAVSYASAGSGNNHLWRIEDSIHALHEAVATVNGVADNAAEPRLTLVSVVRCREHDTKHE